MNQIVTRLDGLDLDSPGRRDYWVALEHDSESYRLSKITFGTELRWWRNEGCAGKR